MILLTPCLSLSTLQTRRSWWIVNSDKEGFDKTRAAADVCTQFITYWLIFDTQCCWIICSQSSPLCSQQGVGRPLSSMLVSQVSQPTVNTCNLSSALPMVLLLPIMTMAHRLAQLREVASFPLQCRTPKSGNSTTVDKTFFMGAQQ